MRMQVVIMESEYQGSRASDERRLLQLQSATARPGHPHAKFTWGNRRSLWAQPRAQGARGCLIWTCAGADVATAGASRASFCTAVA